VEGTKRKTFQSDELFFSIRFDLHLGHPSMRICWKSWSGVMWPWCPQSIQRIGTVNRELGDVYAGSEMERCRSRLRRCMILLDLMALFFSLRFRLIISTRSIIHWNVLRI